MSGLHDAVAILAVFLVVAALALLAWRQRDRRYGGDLLGHWEEQRRARLAARARAIELLRAHLSDEQRAEFDAHGRFRLTAPSGHRYCIRTASAFNVHDETDGVDYCVQFRCDRDGGGIPIEDLMLAQKLLLESDESQFMRIANKRKVMWEPAGGGWLSEAMLHDERRLRGT